METSPRLGRCKDCDYTLFVADAENIVRVDSLNGVNADGRAYSVKDGGHYTFFARCPNRHRAFTLKRIKGTYSPDHKCDSRCLNARGHTCTCSCGGANHGRGYATAHIAEAAPTPTHAYDPQHIGEVSKYIKGAATITTKREDIGPYSKTLLVFTTAKGDIIKNFLPAKEAANFIVGDKISFRAKVKAHEDHPRFGKSTIVVYVEKIND